jgi:hypothetical protein
VTVYFSSCYLILVTKAFIALGNNRPHTLIQLEDCILNGILAISAGKSSEDAIDMIYSQIPSLEKGLRTDEVALKWFNLFMTPISSPSTPAPNLLNDVFRGDSYSLLNGSLSNHFSIQ